MNRLTQIHNQNRINELEIKLNSTSGSKSWHHRYNESAWIYIGSIPYELNEGDIISVFSQYGEIVNINIIRDKKTGQSKGFAFLCYEDQRSTILAVDNFNGIKLCGRVIRVDHVQNYRPSEINDHDDEMTKLLKDKGCAPDVLQEEETSSFNVGLVDKRDSTERSKKGSPEKRKKSNRGVDDVSSRHSRLESFKNEAFHTDQSNNEKVKRWLLTSDSPMPSSRNRSDIEQTERKRRRRSSRSGSIHRHSKSSHCVSK